jgi:glutaredoxin 3
MPVLVYTIENCPYCERAKELLSEEGVPYEEVKVDRRDSVSVTKLVERTKMKTFPQILHGDSVIGGYTDLARLRDTQGVVHLKDKE